MKRHKTWRAVLAAAFVIKTLGGGYAEAAEAEPTENYTEAATSYSAGNALRPVDGKNVHPMYKGKKYHVWDAVSLAGCKRAFILLGMNDLTVMGLEDSKNAYKEVMNKIVETSPGIEIHIISVTKELFRNNMCSLRRIFLRGRVSKT